MKNKKYNWDSYILVVSLGTIAGTANQSNSVLIGAIFGLVVSALFGLMVLFK